MSRNVDKLPSPSCIRPMKVIGLGASRTGTLGLYQALKQLDYHPFHISELLPYGIDQMKVLQDAIIASQADSSTKSKRFGRREYDKMWGEYDCIIESPCYLGTSAIEAYLEDPDVKFILTERSPESFAKSLAGSLVAYHVKLGQFPLCVTKYFDSFVWELDALFKLMTVRWSGGLSPSDPSFQKVLANSYVEYMENVTKLVPPERLLILKLHEGFGWEEICTFLGRPVPASPYPRSNTMSEFHVAAEMVLAPAVTKTMKILGSLAVATLSVGVWYRRRL